MGKRGNGEGSITRHKKSGLYMARSTVQTATGAKRKTLSRRKVVRSSPLPKRRAAAEA